MGCALAFFCHFCTITKKYLEGSVQSGGGGGGGGAPDVEQAAEQ